MSDVAQQNKETALAIWGRDLGVTVDPDSEEFKQHFEKYYTEDYWNHASPAGKDRGLENARNVRKAFQLLFTDPVFEIQMAIADDDKVALIGEFRATHTGLSLYGIEPTGRAVSQPQAHILTFRDGKISEHHVVRDDYVMYQQMTDESTAEAGILQHASEGLNATTESK